MIEGITQSPLTEKKKYFTYWFKASQKSTIKFIQFFLILLKTKVSEMCPTDLQLWFTKDFQESHFFYLILKHLADLEVL